MARRKHYVTVDGEVVSWTYWTLSEELLQDSRLFYWRAFKAALDVDTQGWPADIEELRQRYKNGGTERAVDWWLTWRGVDPATVPAQVKAGAGAGIDFGLMACIAFYQQDWQAIFDGAPVQDDLPGGSP